MFKRWIVVAVLFLLGGVPLAYFVVTSANQAPWLIALVIFFVVAAVFGNFFLFLGGIKKRELR